MNKPLPQQVSKIDAATRQLRQAVHLFLADSDEVAVHTLAAAALQVLADIGQRTGHSSILKHPEFVRPEKLKFVAHLFSAAQNFFKHADRDPDGVLTFFPETTAFYIADAIQLHQRITGSALPAWKVFDVWFALNYPDVLVESPLRTAAEQLLAKDASLSAKPLAHAMLLSLEAAA